MDCTWLKIESLFLNEWSATPVLECVFLSFFLFFFSCSSVQDLSFGGNVVESTVQTEHGDIRHLLARIALFYSQGRQFSLEPILFEEYAILPQISEAIDRLDRSTGGWLQETRRLFQALVNRPRPKCILAIVSSKSLVWSFLCLMVFGYSNFIEGCNVLSAQEVGMHGRFFLFFAEGGRLERRWPQFFVLFSVFSFIFFVSKIGWWLLWWGGFVNWIIRIFITLLSQRIFMVVCRIPLNVFRVYNLSLPLSNCWFLSWCLFFHNSGLDHDFLLGMSKCLKSLRIRYRSAYHESKGENSNLGNGIGSTQVLAVGTPNLMEKPALDCRIPFLDVASIDDLRQLTDATDNGYLWTI